MRAALVIGVLVASTASASADAKQTVAAVPSLGTVERGRTRVVVRGEVARAKQREMVQLVEQVVTDVERRFLGKGDPHPAITLLLFSSAARYKAVASEFGPIPSDWGFYMPRARVGIANVGVSVGNLRHELVHPLIDDDFPDVPAWLNEGLGSLYGTARWTNGRFEFLVNYRLKDLQRALRADTLPSFDTLAATTFEDVHANAMVYYAYARYLLLYLDRKGTLPKFYADMRAATGNTKAQRKVLGAYVDEAAFRTWARGLRAN